MISTTHIEEKLANVQKDDKFWNVMLLQSRAQSGPFDGGCLICAKAIQHAIGGELVRIVSDVNARQTEHYGVDVDGDIIDFDGVFESSESWINNFKTTENVTDRRLWVEHGYDQKSDIIDDPWTVKKYQNYFLNDKEV